MRNTHILACSKRASFFIASVVIFCSTTFVQAQPSTAVERQKNNHLQQIDRLDASWDEASYNMPVRSSAYMKAMIKSRTVSNGLGIYSFKGNVKDAPCQRMADERLKTLALLLRKATDEMTELSKHKIVGKAGMILFNNDGTAGISQPKNMDGELKHLKPLLKFLAYTVSNKPLSLRTMNMDCSTLEGMASDDITISYYGAEALTQVAEKLASTSWMALNKHLAYKYIVASILNIPTFWKYLEPEFFRLVSEGGASTDIIIYVKLHMNREPFILQDSRIWDKAPRFQASQLQLVEADAANQTRHIKKVELNDTETRVTLRYNVGGREMWYRFDNTLALVDNETKELYPIRRIEGNIPLGKTFIVVGCEGKAVEFTFVFPPLKKTVKQFVLDDNLSAPTSEKAKMRFFKKHNIMSDGNGRSPIVIYNLLEFTTTSASVPSSSPSSSTIAQLSDGQNAGNVVNRRVVTSSKPDGRTEEMTYVSDKLVSSKTNFPSGNVEYAYNYVDGVREGDAYRYYETGEVRAKWNYKNGKIVDGVAYYETGELKTKYSYVNGKAEGISFGYYKNGKLRYEYNYVKGQLNGKTKEYRENGETADWSYLSDELVGGIVYYPGGKQQELVNYTKGVRDGESYTYYESGELMKKTTYDNGKITGGVMYYETGEVKTTYSYKNGVLDGPTVSYSKSGKILQETMLKEGMTHGTNKMYYENGNLRLVQNMERGKQNGELIEYDINGNVTSRKRYIDNKQVD